jgi:toxin ParE1/3/4
LAEVIWHVDALEQVAEIAEFIGRESESYALATVEKIFAATVRLTDFPMSGRMLPEARDPNVREVVVDNYRVIYDLRANLVRILAVSHGTRLLNAEDLPHD